eukprot:scpid10470/ scgid12743/ 
MFTDASDAAYAANVYVRAEYPDGNVRVTLALAKARPCPIKKMSIPKLELKGAVLGVCLAKTVNDALDLPQADATYWSDSMNVLHWVRAHSRKFKVDVGNRIAEVQEYSAGSQWNHVPGKLNPADKGTRGLTAAQLASDSVWWNGPEFLVQQHTEWPSRQITVPKELPGMVKRAQVMAFAVQQVSAEVFRLHPDNYSSWKRLVRVTAWCYRFINRCRRRHASTRGDPEAASAAVDSVELKSDELQRAECHWYAIAQAESYPASYRQLTSGKSLAANDPLLRLNPVLDKDYPCVLRVGGRLKTASHLPEHTRHPIILPQHHRITQLIVDAEDRKCDHSVGPNHLLANLMLRFWIIRGKVVTRSHRAHCVLCKKKWATVASQQIAPLPLFRTAPPYQAFSRVGVDYAGPFRTKQGRGKTQLKRYLCVFSCLQSRACHFEMAYGLDTESFLLAFTRFCKRRGVPAEVVSDNGTNFVGAERELREAVQALGSDEVAASMASQGVHWRFNPPLAPHFGGVFECVVKAAKRAMMATLSQANLTDEKLVTAMVSAEGLLNSRSLTAVRTDVDDAAPLTPMHFLAGQCELTLPLEEVAELHPQRRWRLLQQLLREVWRRWLREIVPRLNVLQRWSRRSRNIKPGDIVLCMDKSPQRERWPLAKVMEVFPGSDGLVRVLNIRIGAKQSKRPITQLVPLEVEPIDEGTGQYDDLTTSD